MVKKIKVGSAVAKDSGFRQGYWPGTVKALKGNKALVVFKSRGLSRWCCLKNLYIVDKSK